MITCIFPTMLYSETQLVTVTVKGNRPGRYTNRANVTADNDKDRSNNRDTRAVTVVSSGWLCMTYVSIQPLAAACLTKPPVTVFLFFDLDRCHVLIKFSNTRQSGVCFCHCRLLVPVVILTARAVRSHRMSVRVSTRRTCLAPWQYVVQDLSLGPAVSGTVAAGTMSGTPHVQTLVVGSLMAAAVHQVCVLPHPPLRLPLQAP